MAHRRLIDIDLTDEALRSHFLTRDGTRWVSLREWREQRPPLLQRGDTRGDRVVSLPRAAGELAALGINLADLHEPDLAA